MHSDLEGDILLLARYMAHSFSLAGAGVHITQQTLCFFSLIALQEDPIWSLLQILPLLKHSATGGVGPSGDKGMPEAHPSRDIWNTHMYSRIKVRALKNRQSMTGEF